MWYLPRGFWLSTTNNLSIVLQTYISSLEVALRDEMLQHAPLYGVGLEDMSVEELDALSSIHEEGLRAIHSLQQQKGIPRGNPLMSLSTTAALPPPLVSDGVHHRNGHVNGTDRPPLNYSWNIEVRWYFSVHVMLIIHLAGPFLKPAKNGSCWIVKGSF